MKKIVVLIVGLIAALIAVANAQPVPVKHFNFDARKVALNGYDPVAYFKQQMAVKGKTAFTANYNGVIYQFVSEGNKKLFDSSPGLYLPQYGGWCAYAMGAKGEKVEIDPETFKIVDGKLYLFYNRFFNNTLETWNEDEKRLKSNADKNWIKLTSQ